jgi:hypothetical protein
MKSLLPILLALVPAAGLLGSCASTYHSARFVPSPLEVPLLAEGDPAGQARALLSVRGIRRAKEGRPTEVEMRMRIENLGTAPLTLATSQWELVDSDLNPFDAPELDPPQPEAIAPGDKRAFTALFAVAKGKRIDNYSLGGFNLRLVVRVGERQISTGVSFERGVDPNDYRYPYPPYYYDPFWGPSHFHVGIGTFCED